MQVNHIVKEVNISEIIIGDNSRISMKDKDFSKLMQSIQYNGLLQAIGVFELDKPKKGKKYEIVFGNRRLAAFIKLNRKTIPVRFLDIKEKADYIFAHLTENDQRENIDAFEFGRYCCRLQKECDYTLGEIATKLATSIARIKTCIDIFKKVPEEFAGKIKTMQYGYDRKKGGDIPSSVAKTIIQMQVKYRLKNNQVTQLYKLVRRDPTISSRKLNYVMYFMSQGLSLNRALKKIEDVLIKRYEVSITKKQADKLKEKYGDLNKAIHKIIYSSGEISDPRK